MKIGDLVLNVTPENRAPAEAIEHARGYDARPLGELLRRIEEARPLVLNSPCRCISSGGLNATPTRTHHCQRCRWLDADQ